MKSIFKKLSLWTLSLSLIISTGFISCEVGLGESVDTQPPTLSVITPSANTVIREEFTMTGTCNDEQGVASVHAVLKNTSTKQTFPANGKNFPGVISESGKNWKLTINPLSDDEELKVPDGTYEATVTVTDKAGKTATATRSFVVDNTAPLLVITRPSSKGTDILAKNIDTYGREFNVTGQVADDSNISKMIVKVYNAEGFNPETSKALSEVTLENVPPTLDLTVAKFGEKAYSDIYGDGEGTKYFICEIEIMDEAVHEPLIENDSGNSRKVYYLYNDIYSDILKNYKITEVYHMLNGSYQTDRGLEATKAEVEKILGILADAEKQAKKGTFSLNPANNPSYLISGYDYVTGTDTEKYSSLITNNKLLSGSAMTVKLSSGLDKAPLNLDSMGIYIMPYEYDPIAHTASISKDESKKIWLIKPLVDKLGKGYPIATTPAEIAARDQISAVGSYDYTATLEMTVDLGLITGSAYSVGAVGLDENDVSFVDSGRCGFYYESSGSAPRLVVQEPDASAVYVGKASNPATDVALNTNGTITAENQATITVKVKDTDGGEQTVTESSYLSTEHPNAEVWGPLAIPAKYFKQDASETYTVVITATCGSRVAEKEFTVYYDVNGPVIETPSIAPVVTANGRDDNINGTVKVQVRISDEFSRVDTNSDKKPKLEVFGADNAYTYTSTYASANINDSVDTKLFTDKQLLTFRITAYDVAGNKSIVEKKLYLDQDTDRPVVELTNASYSEDDGAGHTLDYTTGYPEAGTKNVFMAGASATATISDDDSIKSVVVTTYKEDGTTLVSSKEYSVALGTINSNPWPLSYAVPTALGTYKLGIVATDPEGNVNKKSEFYFIVDAGAPTISISAGSSGQYFGKKSGPIEVNGTVTGLGGLKIYQVYDEKDPSKNKEITGTQPDPAVRQAAWTDMFKVSGTAVESEESSTNQYVVVDKKGRTGTATLTYYVDNTAPIVEITNTLEQTEIGGNPASIIQVTSQKFQGSAEDSKGKINSGINSLYYQIVTKGSASPVVSSVEADATSNGWIFLNGANSWNFYKSFVNKGKVEEGSLQEGAYDLYVCAYDVAQNGSVAAKLSFVVDLNTPVVETSYSTNGSDYTTIADAKAIAVQAPYTFAFTLSDTYGLAAVPYSLKITKDGVALASGDYSVTKNGEKYIVSILQTAGKAGRGDGTFVYEVTAKDLNDKVTSVSRTVIRDTEAPVLAVSYPEVDDWLSKNTVKVTGTAEDTSGIAAVYYSTTTTVTPAVGSTALTAANWTNSGWKAVSGTSSWNVTIEGLSEGSVPYYFASVDKYGNVSSVLTHNINYDSGAPAITGTKYTVDGGSAVEIKNNGTATLNKNFTFAGTVTDSYKVKQVIVKAGKDGQAKTEKYNSGDISSQNKKSVDFAKAFTTTEFTDGIWKIEVIAYDAGNREVSADFTFEVDTIAPAVNGVPTLCSNLTPVNGWYNQSRGLISAGVNDSGSGVANVTYLVSDSVIAAGSLSSQNFDNTLNGTNGIYSRTHAFVDGKNYVYIKMEDAAGNVSYYGAGGTYNCQIDTTSPSADFKKPVGGAEINDNEDLKVIVSVSDEGSGFTGTSKATITMSGENFLTGAIPAAGGEVSVVIPKAKLAGKDSPSFKVTIQDKAGNSFDKTISVTIDRDPPVVKINSPVSAKINGNITVAGISTDNVGVDSLEVYRTKLAGDSAQATDITVAAGEWAGTYHLIEKFTGAAVYNWSTSYNTMTAADGTAIKFYVVATDAAGNKGVNGKATEIDQDADRPVITLSNITLNGMTSSAPRLHQEASIRGIISDDDGIKSFKIAENAPEIDWASVAEIYDNGNWEYPVAAGDKTLVFRVVDQNDGVFISNASDITTSPKVIDKNGTSFGYKTDAIKDTKLYLIADLVSPVISVKVNGADPVAYYTSPYTFALDITEDYKLISVTYKIMKDGVELASGENGYKVNLTTDTLTRKTGSIEITGTAAGDGTYSYEITAEDKAGNRVKSSSSFVLDSNAPVLTVTSPEVDEWQTKKAVTIYGTAEDISGISAVYYASGSMTIADSIIAAPLTESKWTAAGWKKLEGKTTWKFTTPDSTPEGSSTYSFAAVDIYGNVTEVPLVYNLFVDVKAPVVGTTTWKKSAGAAITVKDGGKFTTNNGFVLSGTVTDTYNLAKILITATDKLGNVETIYEKNISGTNYAWSKTFVTGSTAAEGEEYKLTDGLWTFDLTVTDKSGKSTKESYSVVVDTVAPVINSKIFTWPAGSVQSGAGYYNSSVPVLTINASDSGSGVTGVYCLNSQEVYYNDGDAGHIQISSIGIDSPMNSTGTANEYSRKISLIDGTNYVYVKVEDEAGNISYAGYYGNQIQALVDTTAPKVNFVAPSVQDQLSKNNAYNFEILLSDDLNNLVNTSSTPAIYANVSATVKIYSDDKSKSVTMTSNLAVDSENSNNVKITGSIPVSTWTTITSDSAIISVEATDGSNNSTVGTLTMTFDNTPPTVRIVNPSLSTVNGKIEISGVAKDNAGLSKVELYRSAYTSAELSNPDLVVSTDKYVKMQTFSGSDAYNWSYSNGGDTTLNTADFADGTVMKFYVVATDTAQNTTSDVKAVTIDQDADRPEIKITNASLTGMTSSVSVWHKQSTLYGTVIDDDGVTALKVATQTEKAKIDAGTITWDSLANRYDSGQWTYAVEEGAQTLYFYVKDSTGQEFISNTGTISSAPKIVDGSKVTFGYKAGSETADTILYLKVSTKVPSIDNVYYRIEADAVDSTWNTTNLTGWKTAAGITAETFGGPGSKLYIFVEASDANGILSTGAKLGDITGTSKYVSPDKTKGVFEIDTSDGSLDGNIKLIVSAEGESTNTYTRDYFITIDNTAPVVKFSSHTSGMTVFGSQENTVMGTATEAIEIFYQVTKTASAPSTSGAGWTDISEYVNPISWMIAFDDKTGSNVKGGNTYHDGNQLNAYLASFGYDIVSDDAAAQNVYIWLYAKDTLGNVSDATALRLVVNPKGDKPTVKITAPSDGEKVGGSIRIGGETSIVTNQVDKVWIQILPNYTEGKSWTNWESEFNSLIAASGKTVVYSVESIKYGGVEKGRGIKVGGSPSNWYTTLNNSDELNGDGSSEITYGIRAYAISTSGKVSEPYVTSFTLDPNSPVISDLALVQYDGSGNVVRSLAYESGMWISGNWTLVGNITDDSGIKLVTVDGKETSDIENNGAQKASGYYNKKLKLPVKGDGEFGVIDFQIIAYEGKEENALTGKATININYDNKAPEFTIDIANNAQIVQSDGTYKISGTLVEESTAEANQSGFGQVAFYFTRTVDGTTYYIDPMVLSGSARKSNRINVSTLTSSDGLYYKTGTIASVNSKEVTLSAAADSTYVRVGGLCKIMDSFYVIKGISGTVITLNSAIDDSAAGKTIYFAMAQVADNTVTENGTTSYYGGGSSITNDDGDQMVESVSISGYTAKWNAYLNSLNIPDGTVDVHFVGFDKAGNHSSASALNCEVVNNRPRLAGVKLATDINGSDTLEESEYIKVYSGIYNASSANKKTGVTVNGRKANGDGVYALEIPEGLGEAVMTIKGLTQIVPEVVGGNEGLGYSYSLNGKNIAYTSLNNTHGDGGNNVIRGSGETTINLTLKDLINAAIPDGNNKTLDLKIWDKTEGKTAGTDSQWASVKVQVNVAIQDTTSPVAVINPFYWNSASDNSLYKNSKNNGHIELPADWKKSASYSGTTGEFDADPKVSGKIVFRGYATDNTQLKELKLTIPGFNNSNTFVIAKYDASSQKWTDCTNATVTSAGVWTGNANTEAVNIEANLSANSWASKVTSSEFTVDGHKAEFEVYWNSAKINNVAALDVNVKATATDRGRASVSDDKVIYTSNTAGESANFRVDVVPYISGIKTTNRSASGLKDSNIRSASGKYSVIKGTTTNFITVQGFNLNPTAGRIVDASQVSGTVTATTGTSITKGSVASDYSSTGFTNNGTKSGYLELFVNGVRTLNNINANDAAGSFVPAGNVNDYANMPNREADYYSTKNVQLNDDRYIRFFEMKDTGANTKNGYYPTLIMNGDKPVFSYLNLSGSTSARAGNNYPAYAMPQRAEFNTDGSESYTEFLVKESAGDQMAMAKDDGGRYHHISVFNRAACDMYYIYDRLGELGSNNVWAPGVNIGSNWYTLLSSSNNNGLCLESVDLGGVMVGRYQYPKMIAKGNSVNDVACVYSAYYDDYYKSIIFRDFQIGKQASISGTKYQLQNNNKSDNSGVAYGQYTNLKENSGWNGSGNSTYTTGRLTAVEKGSKYFDIAVTSDRKVILVYYDEDESCLILKYSEDAVTGDDPTAEISWITSAVTFPQYVGNYVSIALDSSNGIHISAFDANDSDLYYMYLPSYSSTALTEMRIDQQGSVGNWTQIKVKNDVPYIAYYNSTETGGRDSIKLCYANATAGNISEGVDGNNYTTGGWEYMTVPAITPPQGGDPKFQNVCLDFDSTGRPVVGYLGTNLEFGKWLSE